jgi:hypothetical protein
VNGKEKENQESRELQICVQIKGISISAHFEDRRPLDRRGEEGELRDK